MRPTYRRLLAVGTALGVLLSTFAVQQSRDNEAAQKAKVSSLKVTNVKNKKLTLAKGKSFTLKTKVSVKPNKAKYKKVTFKTANKKVASVNSKGKVKAVSAGKTKITVTSKSNKKKKVVVTVTVKNPASKTTNTPLVTPTATAQPATQTPEPPTATQTPAPTKLVTPTPLPTEKPDGTSTLMRKPFAEQAQVGDRLADVEVKSGSILDSNGNEIPGTYEWEQPSTSLDESGKTRHKVKFVPKDSSFATVEHISLPVLTIKRRVILQAPGATSASVGNKLSTSTLGSGSAKDEAGNVVSGKFSWADGDMVLTQPSEAGQKSSFAVVFTPEDTKKYRTEMVYSKVSVTGEAATYESRRVDISGGTWINENAYAGPWQGTFYNLTPYVEGIDLKQYTKMDVKATAYDANRKPLANNNQMYVGIKAANKEGDWRGFSDGYSSGDVSLNLLGYTGGELWLCVQNFSASVAYIEVTGIELKKGDITNVKDGSNLKLAFEDVFGKIGNCMGSYEFANFNNMKFLTTHHPVFDFLSLFISLLNFPP